MVARWRKPYGVEELAEELQELQELFVSAADHARVAASLYKRGRTKDAIDRLTRAIDFGYHALERGMALLR